MYLKKEKIKEFLHCSSKKHKDILNIPIDIFTLHILDLFPILFSFFFILCNWMQIICLNEYIYSCLFNLYVEL